MVVDGVDLALVGPRQIAGELEIVGRIGEDEIDGVRRDSPQLLEAIAHQDAVMQRPYIRPGLETHVANPERNSPGL